MENIFTQILVTAFFFLVFVLILVVWAYREVVQDEREEKKKEREQREDQEKKEREQRERERVAQQKRRKNLYNLVLKIGEESGIVHLRRIVSGFDFKMKCDGLTPKQEELRNTAHQAVREMEQQETEPNYSIPSPLIPQQIPKPFDYQAPWWREYSTWYRNEKRWACEECELDLNYNHYYLHTHHISGTQYNEPKDLEALCFGCHAEKPGERHSELKTDPDYKKFMDEYGAQREDTLNLFYSLSLQFEAKMLCTSHGQGKAKHTRGQYAAEIAYYDTSIRFKPEDATAYTDRGIAKRMLGQFRAAITDFDSAIRLKPNDATAYHNRGWARIQLGQFRAAITDFDSVIRLKPNDATAYHNRGWAKARLFQTQKAKQDLRIALQLATKVGDVQHKKQIESKLHQLKSLSL